MSNRLSNAVSPYLLQHADNPVDWWQWGDEAFAEARRRDVPVFLSVGYAACHWCHVMAHESFEDPQVAAMLNESFVSIKVDREERPDIDAIYMAATTALTGHGGWPMSVWLDHDGRPFYAGTYFPPAPRHSLPSFTQILGGIDAAWRDRREEVLASAARIEQTLQTRRHGVMLAPANDLQLSAGDGPDWGGICRDAVTQLATSFDPRSGGFGRAPKFPPSMVLEFLLRAHALAEPNGGGASDGGASGDGASDGTASGGGAFDGGASGGGVSGGGASGDDLGVAGGGVSAVAPDDGGALDMAAATFEAMARGGMYDQLRGGFARYSVDANWVVPHFEKMLYDNALLLRAYAHWWRATGSPLAERVVRETVEFLLADLRTAQGGFAASLDADAAPPEDPSGAAHEGASYVWRPEQLRAHLGDVDGTWVAELCEVTPTGTFEKGTSTLQLRRDPDDPMRWAKLRARLRDVRDSRPQPARDDKVVAAWNGLAIAALADAGDIFDQPQWVDAAAAAADLLVAVHLCDDATLARVSRDGEASTVGGVLADYADVAEGLLALYRATGEQSWYLLARNLLDSMVTKFFHNDQWADHLSDGLLPMSADPSDNAEPSGVSAAMSALVSLVALGGSVGADPTVDLASLVAKTMAGQVPLMREHPRFAGQWLSVAAALAAGPREVAVVADSRSDVLLRTAVLANSPGLVIAFSEPGASTEVPLLSDRVDAGAPLAYVCRLGACQLPTDDPEELRRQLG